MASHFFINGFDRLGDSELKKLRELQNYGHEIGCHTLNHSSVKDYVKKQGIGAYVENEIHTATRLMSEKDFRITSFAYPYGDRNKKIDAILLNEFKVIRGTTNIIPYHPSFIRRVKSLIKILLGQGFNNSKKLVFSHSIDNTPNTFYDEMLNIKFLLNHAKNEKRICILHAHKPVETADGDCQIEQQRLIKLCEYINNNKMKFILMSDLYEINKKRRTA